MIDLSDKYFLHTKYFEYENKKMHLRVWWDTEEKMDNDMWFSPRFTMNYSGIVTGPLGYEYLKVICDQNQEFIGVECD